MFSYIKKFFDSTDGSASLRNAAFALVVAAGVIYLGAELVVGLVRYGHGISADWNVGFGILVGGVTGSKLVGQHLHNIAGPGSDPEKAAAE